MTVPGALCGAPAPLIRHPGRAAPPGVRYFCTVDNKNALRAGALVAGTTLMMLLMTSPALAVARDDGDDPGPGLSVIETLGLYVVAPIGLFAIIAGLVMVLDRSSDRAPKAVKPAKAKA
jgi:hypothetical protein